MFEVVRSAPSNQSSVQSEVWRQTRHQDWGSLGRALLSNWKLFLYLTVLMAGMNFSSHGTQDNFPDLLTKQYHMAMRGKAGINAIGAVGAIYVLFFAAGGYFKTAGASALILGVGLIWLSDFIDAPSP